MGRNLSTLFISQSYQFLTQISGSELQDGLGNTITGSLAITSSQAISSSFATTASFALNAGTTVSTASLLTTASATNNVITFTKGDSSQFTVTVATGSAATVNTGSLLVTASISNATTTFTKGDGSTFSLTANNVVNATSSSYASTSSKVSIDDDNGNTDHKVTFVNTTVASGGEQLLIDPTATQFTYNPSTNLLTVTSSYANFAVSSSNSATSISSSYSSVALSSSFATSAQTATSSSFATSAATATSASFATNANTATSASFATSAASATSASFATTAATASYYNEADTLQTVTTRGNSTSTSITASGFYSNGTITTQNAVVLGTASIAFLDVTYQSSSVIYSSGSNQFGDASNDVQTLFGTVDIKTGPLKVTGSADFQGGLTGSLLGTASFATNALSASFAPSSPAFPFTGSAIITGSLQVSGTLSTTPLLTAGATNNIGRIVFETGYDPGPMAYRDYLYSTTNDFAIGLSSYKETIRISPGEVGINIPLKVNNNATIIGNTTLGDSSSDITTITGSLSVTGSLNVNGNIITGDPNNTSTGHRSAIIGGGAAAANIIYANGTDSVIAGGSLNKISASNSFIGGGRDNRVEDGEESGIIGGFQNLVSEGDSNFIGGGDNNTVSGSFSSILAGASNSTSASLYSAIVGGNNNSIAAFTNTVIIGGNNITAAANNTVYVPNLVVTGSFTGTVATASFATSASFAATSSFFGGIVTSASYAVTGGGLISGTGAGATTAMRSAPYLTTTPATASGANSIALGSGATTNLGNGGIAIGTTTQAAALRAVAIGNTSLANGANAVAIGYNVTASGTNGVNINGIFNFDGTTIRLSNSTVITGSLTVSGSQIITGSLRGEVAALTISSNTASLNCATNNFFTLTLVSGSNTFINPSNIAAGQTINLRITQANPGNGTVSFPTSVKQVSGSSYVPSTGTGPQDIVTFISFDTSSLYLSNVKNLV